MGGMAGTTSEKCVCRTHALPALVAAWRGRVEPVLARKVNEGRAINHGKVALSAKLVEGIPIGMPSSFDERYRGLAHHLSNCPLACREEEVALALLS